MKIVKQDLDKEAYKYALDDICEEITKEESDAIIKGDIQFYKLSLLSEDTNDMNRELGLCEVPILEEKNKYPYGFRIDPYSGDYFAPKIKSQEFSCIENKAKYQWKIEWKEYEAISKANKDYELQKREYKINCCPNTQVSKSSSEQKVTEKIEKPIWRKIEPIVKETLKQRILRNWVILKNFTDSKKTLISYDKLLKEGFDFDAYEWESKINDTYCYFIYNFVYYEYTFNNILILEKPRN